MSRTISQISCSAAYGGIEILYALCSDNTVWRCAYDRVLGEVVWREVPPIDAAPREPQFGATFSTAEPELDLSRQADPERRTGEKQW